MTVYRFPVPPSSNRYWRHYRGRMVVSDEARQYKETIKMLARCDGAKLLTGPVLVTIRVFRARKSGDLDNFAKVAIDALQGCFYVNDSQIRELHMRLEDDRHDPRIEVEVTRLKGDDDESGSNAPGA